MTNRARHAATFSFAVCALGIESAPILLPTGAVVFGVDAVPEVPLLSAPQLDSLASSQGTSSTRCPRSASSGVNPMGAAFARISPRSLMLIAFVNCHPEPGAISVFRSSIGPPSSQTNACRKARQSEDPPTACPRALIPRPRLHASPFTVPRSMIFSVFPNHRIMQAFSRQIRGTHNHSCIVDPDCLRVRAAQRAQIVHHAAFPEKRSDRR